MSDKKDTSKSEGSVKKENSSDKKEALKDIKVTEESKVASVTGKGKSGSSFVGKTDIADKKDKASRKKDKASRKKDKASRKEDEIKTFKAPPPLEKNPLINILDQHQAHRLKIAKLIAVIFVTFIVVFFLVLASEHWAKVKKQNKRVLDLEKKINLLKAKSDKLTGFKSNQAIASAIILTYRGEKTDWEHFKKWQKRRDELFASFHTALPEFSKSFVLPAIAMDMMAIPQGEFMMGRGLDEARGCTDELPKRKITINYPFWMSKTEITNFQYRIFFPQHTEKKYDGYALNLITQPVVQVSWHLAVKYCEMLTFHERKAGRLPPGYIYRLPTEAEWEYACRASTDTVYYWGNEFGEKGKEYANALDRNSASYEGVEIFKESPQRDGHYVTAPVASFKPNAFGLYDMSGNVWEWCWDWYNPAAYLRLPTTNPVQTSPVVTQIAERGNFERIQKIDSTSKIIRGGGWLSPPYDCRSATRDSVVPEKKDNGIGFRIVLAPEIEMLGVKDSSE